MKKILQYFGFSLLVLALVVVPNLASATLTLDALTVTSSGALTLTGATASAITVGAAAQTGTISVGDSTGAMTMNLASGNSIKTINLGTGTGVKTIHIGDNATPANVITIGGAASGTTVKGTLTVGVDDTGHDVLLYGATTGKSWLWDESADKMIVTGTTKSYIYLGL